jgi:multidrug efflux system outer membrane protein
MTSKTAFARPIIVGAVLGLAACAEAPEFVSLDQPLPLSFAATPDVVLPREVDVIWWRSLDDPIANQLVTRVYESNLTLRIAQLRLREAEELNGVTTQAVTVSGDAALLAQRDIEAEKTTNGATGNLGLTWLFDISGSQAADAALAENNVALNKAELAVARQTAVTNVLNAYVDLRFQQARLRNLEAEVSRRRTTISQQERSVQAGDVTEIDLTNARAQLAARRTELPTVRAEIEILKSQIAVLLGGEVVTLDSVLSETKPQPVPHNQVIAGLPADLLRNRADLFILERAYYAAVLGVTQERAAYYPRLTLGGSLSTNTIGTDRSLVNIGPRIELPVLPTTVTTRRVNAAELRVQIAYEEWAQATLAAVASSEAALRRVQASQTALQSANQSVALSRKSLDLTQRVLSFDGATLEDVTNAENRVAAAEATRAQLRRDLTRDYIDLQQQLGSGEVLSLSGRTSEVPANDS